MRRRFLGFDEIWRENSTGTRRFFILWVCVWTSHFTHSTWMSG